MTISKQFLDNCVNVEYPYLNNTYVDPRLYGYPTLLSPFGNMVSAPRLEMLSKHLPQSMVVTGADFPELFTGMEYDYGTYTFDLSKRESDVEVLLVLSRYSDRNITKPPYYIVVCRDLSKNKITYFKIESYQKGAEGFGHLNTINREAFSKLIPGATIPKEVDFVRPPTKNGSEYNGGLNVNTAYMTVPGVIQDAMVISTSCAKKLESDAVHSLTFDIPIDAIPLNTHGTDSEHKIIPDIGEYVTDGVLIVLRNVMKSRFAADQDPSSFNKYYPLTDTAYIIPKGSRILDIQVVSKRDNTSPLLSQLDKYRNADILFYTKIVEHYRKLIIDGRSIKDFEPTYLTLVTHAITQLISLNAFTKQLGATFSINRKAIDMKGSTTSVIDNIQVTVTYTYVRQVQLGFKITDQYGNKGVISQIVPDHKMPHDAYGVRADLITSPDTGIKRMNVGQFYHHGITGISKFVLRKARAAPSVSEKYNIILDWIGDVNPNFKNLLLNGHHNDPNEINDYVQECFSLDKIRINIPPFLKTCNLENIATWSTKWDVQKTQLRFTVTTALGDKEIVTKNKFLIGSKYIYLLSKIPQSSAIAASFVNSYGIPSKPSSFYKNRYIVSPNPIRFGEDEVRIMNMTVERLEVNRLLWLHSTSLQGTKKLIETLLVHNTPSAIQRIDITNDVLYNSCTINALLNHMMATSGIDSVNTVADFTPPVELQLLEDEIDMNGPKNVIRNLSQSLKEGSDLQVELEKLLTLDDDDDEILSQLQSRKHITDNDDGEWDDDEVEDNIFDDNEEFI